MIDGIEEAGLKVKMFGRFEITYNGERVQVGGNQSTKALQLLQMLLHAGPKGLSRAQVLEYLFGFNAEGDIANNLRVISHNLRKHLAKSGLPEYNYIIVEDGYYRFACPYPIEVDVVELEKIMEALKTLQGEERIPLLREVCRLYDGYFLPDLQAEEWVILESARYQRMYFDCMDELCEWLKKEKEYEELLGQSGRAAAIYPFDEWQIWQIDALLLLNRPKEAYQLYEKTTTMYFDELAMTPSDRMMDCFHRMAQQIQMGTSNLLEIQHDLMEDSVFSGAYFCSFPSFVDCYRMAVRIMERSGQSIYLLLCTLTDESEKLKDDSQRLKEVSDNLYASIHEALRRGDVFCKYNMRQYLVILTGIRKEECSVATNRIDAAFRKRENSRKLKITYRVSSIAHMTR